MIDPERPDYANTPASGMRASFHYRPADPLAPPLVTIVTPFFNTGPLFHETARSVLSQSFQQWEWLIVNDGTTATESITILDSYRRVDARIRVVDHERNQGLSAARNTGFRAARTDYIVQLDSDDLLEPTAVEKWYWFLQSFPEYGFVKGFSIGFGARQYLWRKGFHNGKDFLKENLVDATSMIRKVVYEAAGGYDEGMREGLEDWDFWLRCANQGYWGATIPEFLNWYRRRAEHSARWANLQIEKRQSFAKRLRQRYPRLWQGGFPEIEVRRRVQDAALCHELPCGNLLQKERERLLVIAPSLSEGGFSRRTLELLRQLSGRGWEVTVAGTDRGDNSQLHLFSQQTPDVFVLAHFLYLPDFPRFLRYLIASRQVSTVMISHSELGYRLLPYLRPYCPDTTFVDLTDM
jgi:GT2 family glycosyltransferase